MTMDAARFFILLILEEISRPQIVKQLQKQMNPINICEVILYEMNVNTWVCRQTLQCVLG